MSTQVDDHLKVDSLVSPSTPADGQTAVIYLRVSTKEQAEKGSGDEGYSIPAQRNANMDKADRPALMQMIKYVSEHRVNYCIVHKIDRLARNRVDDVSIHLALRDTGALRAAVRPGGAGQRPQLGGPKPGRRAKLKPDQGWFLWSKV